MVDIGCNPRVLRLDTNRHPTFLAALTIFRERLCQLLDQLCEPIFVPRPDAADDQEDDGVILSVILNQQANRSCLLVLDAKTFKEVARIPTTKKSPHGIAFSPDGRYAFVTQESIGSDPGAVDAIDLVSLTKIATMEIPRQPTGIATRRDGR